MRPVLLPILPEADKSVPVRYASCPITDHR